MNIIRPLFKAAAIATAATGVTSIGTAMYGLFRRLPVCAAALPDHPKIAVAIMLATAFGDMVTVGKLYATAQLQKDVDAHNKTMEIATIIGGAGAVMGVTAIRGMSDLCAQFPSSTGGAIGSYILGIVAGAGSVGATAYLSGCPKRPVAVSVSEISTGQDTPRA